MVQMVQLPSMRASELEPRVCMPTYVRVRAKGSKVPDPSPRNNVTDWGHITHGIISLNSNERENGCHRDLLKERRGGIFLSCFVLAGRIRLGMRTSVDASTACEDDALHRHADGPAPRSRLLAFRLLRISRLAPQTRAMVLNDRRYLAALHEVMPEQHVARLESLRFWTPRVRRRRHACRRGCLWRRVLPGACRCRRRGWRTDANAAPRDPIERHWHIHQQRRWETRGRERHLRSPSVAWGNR